MSEEEEFEEERVIETDLRRFEKHVDLRFNMIKKQINQYFNDLSRAIREGRPLPIPAKAKETEGESSTEEDIG